MRTLTRPLTALTALALLVPTTGAAVAGPGSPVPATPWTVASGRGAAPCVTDFADAPPTGSFYTAITWMACAGITAGYSDGSFGKARQITRGETAQFLYRMSGEKHEPGTARDFKDVNPGGAGFTAISWMQAEGLSAGYANGRFGINDPISRGELAAFMYRMGGSVKSEVPAKSPFTDMKTTTPFYNGAAWLKSTQLVAGYADGTFRPGPAITRGQTAAFLYALETHLHGTPAPPKVSPKPYAPAGLLPSADLKFGAYTGSPRQLEEIFHLECIHALDGEDIPDREDATLAPGEKPVWSVHNEQKLTQGWKVCPTRMYEQMAIPAAFTVQADTTDGRAISRLRITGGSGHVTAGFQNDVTGRAPDSTRLLKALEITELPMAPSAGGEVRYLRTLLVDTASGPQLLIDQVSASAGTDPKSLTVWDLVAGPGERDLVYASIRLDTAAGAQQAADSHLADVLRSMVGSFTPGVM
jgi:hypothetical protein